MSAGEIRVAIKSDQDIVVARQRGRALAAEAGFSSGDATLIATAISELARNIVSYARKGEITLKIVYASIRQGILIVASDKGLGLPGVRRLMDEFEITSEPGRGTIVTVKKWRQ